MNPDETVDQAAKRELEEETGLGDIEPAQLRLFSAPGRDPRGWVITQAFIAVIDEDQHTVTAGDDRRWRHGLMGIFSGGRRARTRRF